MQTSAADQAAFGGSVPVAKRRLHPSERRTARPTHEAPSVEPQKARPQKRRYGDGTGCRRWAAAGAAVRARLAVPLANALR